MRGFDERTGGAVCNGIAHSIFVAGVEVGRVHQVVFARMFEYERAFVPAPFRRMTSFPILFGPGNQARLSLECKQVVVQFGYVKMTFMAACNDVFATITGVVEVFAPIIIEKDMPVNSGIAEIKHWAVGNLHKRAERGFRHGHAQAQALVLSPTGAVVHEIFALVKDHLGRPEIGFAPRIRLALVDVSGLLPVNQVGRGPGLESIRRRGSVAIIKTIRCAQNERVTDVFDGQGVLIGERHAYSRLF